MSDQDPLLEILDDPQAWAESLLIHPSTGNPFKANYIERQVLSAKGNRLVLRTHRRGGKACGRATTIYTPSGITTMGEVKLGDVICTPNGETAKVIGIYPQGELPVYRLTLDDGTYVDASEDHLWEVYTGVGYSWDGVSARKKFGSKVLTTKEIMDNLVYTYSNRREYRFKLNPITPVQHTKKELPVDPYLLGVLLGDRHLASISIHCTDPEIIDRIRQRTSLSVVLSSYKGHCPSYRFSRKDLKDKLISLGLFDKLSHTKFIPQDYLYSCVEDRLELLRGLMDTDGSADAGRCGQAEYCSVSEVLANNVATLCRSLGCKVTVAKSKAGYTKNRVRKITKDRYRLSIRIPEGLEIFSLPRKKCGGLPIKYLRRTIVKVEPLGIKEDMQCIEVDHPSKLYLINNYTPTHNTESLVIITLWSICTRRNYKVLVLAPQEAHVQEFFEKLRDYLDANPSISQSVVANSKSPFFIKLSNGSAVGGKTTGASSNSQGIGIRGKGADMVIIDEAAYLREKDFSAIVPIFDNDIYRQSVRVIAASTPNSEHGRFYDWCTSELGWEQIHIPITENPDMPKEKVADIRATHSDLEWIMEDMAEFPDAGDNVFRHTDIDHAKKRFSYMLTGFNPASRKVIGVDWDKYQAGVNIAVVELLPNSSTYRLLYREEVPRGEYTLLNSVERVIGLNQIFKPDFLYIDRGYGEHAVEALKMYGIKHPESNLKDKVVGVSFAENVEIRDPVDGKTYKKQFKAVMINAISKVFEDRRFEFPDSDKLFEKQLREYRLLGASSDHIRTTRKNEHIIDAVGLAIYGLYSRFCDDLVFVPAKESVIVPAPKIKPSRAAILKDKEFFSTMRTAFTDKRVYAGIGRGTLASKPPQRSRF